MTGETTAKKKNEYEVIDCKDIISAISFIHQGSFIIVLFITWLDELIKINEIFWGMDRMDTRIAMFRVLPAKS